jgi:hypothetical protein
MALNDFRWSFKLKAIVKNGATFGTEYLLWQSGTSQADTATAKQHILASWSIFL